MRTKQIVLGAFAGISLQILVTLFLGILSGDGVLSFFKFLFGV